MWDSGPVDTLSILWLLGLGQTGDQMMFVSQAADPLPTRARRPDAQGVALWVRLRCRPRRPRERPVQGPAVTAHPLGGIVLAIPSLRLVNETNTRGHTLVKSRRIASTRAAVLAVPRTMGGVVPPPRAGCRSRAAPRRLDDDGAVAAAKSTRDSVAEWLGSTTAIRASSGPSRRRRPLARVEIVPVRPFGGITTARVTQDGATTTVECVLGPRRSPRWPDVSQRWPAASERGWAQRYTRCASW